MLRIIDLKFVPWSHIYSHLMALEETMLKVVTLFKTSHFKSCDSWQILQKPVTLKVVTLFKTSHFKSCDSWQILQKPVTLKIVTLGNLFFKTCHW